jgi:hypothetical protein
MLKKKLNHLYKQTHDLLTYEIMNICRKLASDNFMPERVRKIITKELNDLVDKRNMLTKDDE